MEKYALKFDFRALTEVNGALKFDFRALTEENGALNVNFRALTTDLLVREVNSEHAPQKDVIHKALSSYMYRETKQ